MKSRFRPQIEKLEDRCVPAQFGNPWPDGMHLTLSFAPDGTVVDGSASNLTQLLSPLGQSAAKLEILRAFQTWAVNANLNVGLVGDGGQDFNTGGAIENDPRFGDVRIGARTMPSSVLAVTAPFNLFSSFSGNAVLNNTDALSIGTQKKMYDLFSVFLHEAGHAFSLDDNSTNSSSAMYYVYTTTRTGLSAADIASIQALYGARGPDAFEGSTGNNSLATATSYSQPLEADLGSVTDVDCYRYTTPLLTLGTTISLKATGVSLVTAKVEVLDASGNVVASGAAVDPTNNDVTLNLSNLRGGSKYYIRVSSARSDVFGVGTYDLSIKDGLNNILSGTVGLVTGALNNTLGTALILVQNVVNVGSQYDYTVRSTLSTAGELDFYQFRAPQAPAGTTVNLVATVWGLNGASLKPSLMVYDAAGNAIAAQILTRDDGSCTVQVQNATPDANYYLRVKSDSGQIGNYEVAVDFSTTAVTFPMGSTGTLSNTLQKSSATLTATQPQQMHFVLGADPIATANAQLVLTIYNSKGHVVYQLTTTPGEFRSGDIFLAAGTYTAQVSLISTNGSSLPAVEYYVSAVGITDPVGAATSDTTSSPSGGTSSGSGSAPPSDGSSTYWSSQYPSDGTYWY